MRWVSAYLATYCGPGLHTWLGTAAGLRWCTVCYKEEAADGGTCLVCDRPGAGQYRLDGPQDVTASGPLCDDCAEGMAGGRAGWRAAPL